MKLDGNGEEAGFEPHGLCGSTKARRTQVSQAVERAGRFAAEQGLAVAAERPDLGSAKSAFTARGHQGRAALPSDRVPVADLDPPTAA